MKANHSFTFKLGHLVNIHAGEEQQVALMAALLFFLLAANNVIKIVRDALFLSRFPITQLPYVYLLAAAVAGVVIGIYGRCTTQLSLARIIFGSLAMTIATVIGFWLLVTFSGAGWVVYAYYIWSAIAGLVLVSQFWMLANGLFNARDGKRLFGLVTAGGTLGAMAAGLAANWMVRHLLNSKQLLWLVAALLGAACAVSARVLRANGEFLPAPRAVAANRGDTAEQATEIDRGVMGTVLNSSYLKTIAALIFVSVVVSTLIDYQFKAAAKATYPTADGLAQFFGSYYAWLGAVTLLAQLWLAGKVLVGWGLTPSLLFLPVTLIMGSFGLLLAPGLATATATRMAEATLRTSVHQSAMQILFLPLGDAVKKKAKVFLDVTTERLGDGIAALIILALLLTLGTSAVAPLSYFVIALIALWLALVRRAQRGYLDALRASLSYREVSFANAAIDFTDKATLETVLKTLDGKDESAVLFALDLAEKMDRPFVAARLPLALLQHPSAEVRRRTLRLLVAALEPNVLELLFEIMTSEYQPLRAQAIAAMTGRLRRGAAASASETAVGALSVRREALDSLRKMLAERSAAGEKNRLEAVRALGEWIEPEFAGLLSAVIREDPSILVVREAMAAAAKGKYASVVAETIARLGANATKSAARAALIQYGEPAVKGLRTALSDDRVSREVRLNIPATLSKIPAQVAMNALMAGLLEEDRMLRFKAILAVEEMSRRFTDLKVDRDIIESAILSDAQLYCRRLVLYAALFEPNKSGSIEKSSLLFHALTESLERVRQRVIWLLALIYPAQDIRRAWAGLNSSDKLQRAHATEFIDNLLTGEIKKHLLPLYSDAPPERRLRAALEALDSTAVDGDGALRALLRQEDRWLKAAALWEIGRRRVEGFGDAVATLTKSADPLLRETAQLVAEGEVAP